MKLYSKAITFFFLLLLIPSVSFAAMLETVTNNNDSGPGSLRQALADVDPFGEVRLDASIDGMTIALTSGELVIDKDISLIGVNAPNTIIDGTALGAGNVLRIASLDLNIFIGTINITGDMATQTGLLVGSGAMVNSVNIRIFEIEDGLRVEADSRFDTFDSIFEDSFRGILVLGGTGSTPGGILTCNECLISDNTTGVSVAGGTGTTADGGSASLSESTVIGNTTGIGIGGGNGGSAQGSSVSLRKSTVQNNDTGAVVNSGQSSSAEGGSLLVINSTFTRNDIFAIRVFGGELDLAQGGLAEISFSTIWMNFGEGLFVNSTTNANPGQIDIKNSIVAATTGMDCNASVGEIVSTGVNFDEDGTCNALDGDFTTTTQMALNLGPLQGNGGMTQTYDLIIPSVAIDAAPDCTDIDGGTIEFDQRFFPRPVGASCDVGSVEQQPTGTITIEKQSIPDGGTGFLFLTEGFPFGCDFSTAFSIDDDELKGCILPLGQYTFSELLPPEAGVNFDCSDQPVNQTFDSITLDLSADENIFCIFTNDTRQFILNPIFPAIASNFNEITAEDATAEGPVAFIWGFMPGNVVVGGSTCNGLEVDIKQPRILAIVDAFPNGFAEYLFWIPLIGDFDLAILTQAIDIDTCRKSEVITNIIRKE